MHRQTFVSNSFFVPASVAATKNILQLMPDSITYLQFVCESDRQQSLRYLYQPAELKNYQVDVSLLPLNTEYTQVTVHLSYADGHTFQYDSHIRQALASFEGLVQNVVNGKNPVPAYPAKEQKQTAGWVEMLSAIAASVTGLFIWKKLS